MALIKHCTRFALLALGLGFAHCAPIPPEGIVEFQIQPKMSPAIIDYRVSEAGDTVLQNRIFIVPATDDYIKGLDVYIEFIAKSAPPHGTYPTYYNFMRHSVYSNVRNYSQNPEDYQSFRAHDLVAFVEVTDGEVGISWNAEALQGQPLPPSPLIRWPLPWN